MWSRSLCFVWQRGEHTVFSGSKFVVDQPLDVAHVIISVESTPFHTRVQPEQSFGDTLHLRSVVSGSASIVGLSPKRRRFVMAVNPHPVHFCVRVSSRADPSV